MPTKTFSGLLVSALCTLALMPQPAAAEAGRAALVIGNSAYPGGAALPACGQSARDVGAWLRQRGFEVEEAIDATSVAMRSAIGNFVTLASNWPQKTVIVYVCTYAAISNQRLFMLPVDSDPRQPTRLETQGIIVKALLNTLAGTNGVLFADLGLQPDKTAVDAVDALQAGLQPGTHFAVVARNDAGIGSLGRTLPGLLGGAGQDWGRLATVFQAQQGPSRADRLAVFAPLTGPMPPMQEGGPAAAAQTALAPHPEPAQTLAAAPSPASPPSSPVAADHPTTTAPAAPTMASAGPASNPPVPDEAPKALAGTPLQIVPPSRLAGATPQAANIAGAEQQGQAEPDAAAPKAGAPPAPQASPAAPTIQATQQTRPSDSRIGRIQAALARRGFYSGGVTGRSDGRTRDAIRAFQNSLGDAPNGVLTQIQIVKLLNLGP